MPSTVGVSPHTVDIQIKHVYTKLAVTSRTQAVYEDQARELLP